MEPRLPRNSAQLKRCKWSAMMRPGVKPIFFDAPEHTVYKAGVILRAYILRAYIERPGMGHKITAEYWNLRDYSHLLELWRKCPTEETVVVREVFGTFFGLRIKPERINYWYSLDNLKLRWHRGR